MSSRRRLYPGAGPTAAAAVSLLAGGLMGRADSFSSAADVRAVAGGPARVVWCRQVTGDGGDPFATNAWYALMALDTESGRERALIQGPASIRKPLLSPDGRTVVFTDFVRGRVCCVPFAGGTVVDLAPGHAADVWAEPGTSRLWVYAVKGPLMSEAMMGSPVVRFPIDQPKAEEIVWSKTPVSTDNFQVSPAGDRAVGLFPWPSAGWAELPEGELRRFGRGCWTSRAPDESRRVWLFDGAHRNLQVFNLRDNRRWTVPVNTAPGMNGAEVYHPRWGRPARLLALSGPYMAGSGAHRIGFGGPQVEIYIGRFSDDFTSIAAWAQITRNEVADYFPDVWAAEASAETNAVRAAGAAAPIAAAARTTFEGRVTALTRAPTLADIRPYRQALVAYEYEVLRTIEGPPLTGRILVLHWGVREGRTTAPRRRIGDAERLTVEPFDARPELEGERVVMDMDGTGRPLYVEAAP